MHTSALPSALAHGPEAGTAEYQRNRLAGEIAFSLHEVVTWKCLAEAVKSVMWALLTLLLAVIFLAATVAMVKKNLMPSALFGGGVTVGLFLLGLWQISKSVQTYTDRLGDIAVCPTACAGIKVSMNLWPYGPRSPLWKSSWMCRKRV